MGGKPFPCTVTGEKTCNFTSSEEATRFLNMMKAAGYEVEKGIYAASAEDAAEQVATYHSNLGSSLGPRIKLPA
jgi:predicted flavoprotein YhiN